MASARQSVVLEETYDDDYEPTDEEIAEYADFLGMDVAGEPHLVWIAREGLQAPLPAEWKPCETDDGQVYYFNFSTGESRWDHPCDDVYKKLYEAERLKNPVPPAGWTPDESVQRVVNSRRESDAPSSLFPDSPTLNFMQIEHVPEAETVHVQTVSSPFPVATPEASRAVSATSDTISEAPKRLSGSSVASTKQPVSLVKLTKDAKSMKQLDTLGRPAADGGHSLQNLATSPAPERKASYNAGGGISVSPSRKSYLGSILDHIDDSLESKASMPTVETPMAVPVVTGHASSAAAQLSASATASRLEAIQEQELQRKKDELKQKEAMAKLVQDRLEDVKKHLAEQEKEERRLHELKLNTLRETLAAERESFERDERRKIETSWTDKRREIEGDYLDRRRVEERRFNEEFESFRKKMAHEFQVKEDQEKARLARDFEDSVKKLRRETEEKVLRSVDEKEFKIMADRKLRVLEEQLEHDMDKVRSEYHAKRAEMIKTMVDREDEERRKIDIQLQEIRSTVKQRKDEEEAAFEQEMSELRAQWNTRIRSTEKELEAKEKNLRAQLSEVHQRQLKDKESEYERMFERIDHEWQEKLNELKHTLAVEQSEWEEKLVRQRKHNSKEVSGAFPDTLNVRRQEIDRLTKENDQIFSQQKRRRDFLETETKLLDKMQEQIDSRKRQVQEQKIMVLVEEEQMDAQPAVTILHPQSARVSRAPSRQQTAQTLMLDYSDEYQQQDTLRPVSPSKSSFGFSRRASSISRQPSRAQSRKATAIVHDDEELGIESLEENAPPLNAAPEKTAISRELDRNLKRQERNISQTKEYLQEQQTSILSRQNELESSRQRRKEELHELNKKLEASAEATFLSQIQSETNPAERTEPDMERVDEELSSIIRQLRNSMDAPKPRDPEYEVGHATPRSLNYFGARPKSTLPLTARAVAPARPYFDRSKFSTPSYKLGSSYSSAVPSSNYSTNPAALSQLSKWEDERKKSDDILKGHSVWLQDFRQKIGLERSTFTRARPQ